MLPLLAATSLFAAAASAVTLDVHLDDVLYNGTVVAEAVSVPNGLDAPRLSSLNANESSYDWWYFDAVSAGTDASVTVVFYNGGPGGFINSFEGGPFTASISGTFANGTVFAIDIPATAGVDVRYGPGDAIDVTYRNADTGDAVLFVGVGLTAYALYINAPTAGVTGSIALNALAPPHYPCGAGSASGSDEAMVPHVWWANAVPDALATVDLHFGASATGVGGDLVQFADGLGYHDKNWGDANFVASVTAWYWGHARVGPYSIVWFDALDRSTSGPSGGPKEHVAGYVAAHGQVLTASCAPGALQVRPWGANADYPPHVSTGVMQGLLATFALADGRTFVANITTGAVAIDLQAYVRTLGTVTGGIVGETTYTGGRAAFEEFKFT